MPNRCTYWYIEVPEGWLTFIVFGGPCQDARGNWLPIKTVAYDPQPLWEGPRDVVVEYRDCATDRKSKIFLYGACIREESKMNRCDHIITYKHFKYEGE